MPHSKSTNADDAASHHFEQEKASAFGTNSIHKNVLLKFFPNELGIPIEKENKV